MPFVWEGAAEALYRLDLDLSCARVDAGAATFRFAMNEDGSLGARVPRMSFEAT